VTAPPLAAGRARALARAIADFYAGARRDLPWRRTRDPYAIWISEIMCQQTKVATAVPYWERWLARFPSVAALAAAPLDDVLASWAGLGYYARARNLHRGAAQVAAEFAGALPADAAGLRAIAGIGPYTAAAIASIAFDEPIAVVDGNVARVAARLVGLDEDVKSRAGALRVQAIADALMAARPPGVAPGDLNQGLMELGALVCTPAAPRCDACPCRDACVARATGRTAELPVLPVRRKAAELPELRRVALLILDEADAVLLARRAPSGLFGGLWELPQADTGAAAAAAIGAVATLGRAALAAHAQLLSHRRLALQVVAARVRDATRLGKALHPSYDAVGWFDPTAAARLGLARSTASLLQSLRRDGTWTSMPRRWRTSRLATSTSSRGSVSSATTSPTRTSATPRRARPRASTSSASARPRSKTK
jgi:A/G-specific adenine glycosylase